MSKGRGNALLFRNCQGGEAIPTMAELISTYKLLTVWIPAGIFLDSLFQSLPIQCWYHLVGCALHNYVLTSVMQTSIMLRNTICPQRYTVLAVALFHTGVSRAQPVHASSNKAKAESLTEKQKLEEVESEGPAEHCQQPVILKKRRQRVNQRQ